MHFLILITLICLLWYFLKILAHFSKSIHQIVKKLSVYTLFFYKWIQASPATFAYVSIFCVSTLIQRTNSSHLIANLINESSTNLSRASEQPFIMFVDSALWVADKGAGLVFYVLIFLTVVSWAEQRYGSPRLIIIGITGHVIGSILTMLLELWAINNGMAPQSLATTTDVGVSYIMISTCAAALLLMRNKALLVGLLTLFAFIVGPLFFERSIWDMGHLFATIIGFSTSALSLKLLPLRKADTPAILLSKIQRGMTK